MQKWLIAFAVAAPPLVPTAAVSAQGESRPNHFWWPEQLDLSTLRQHAAESNPLGEEFDYPKAFTSLNLNDVKLDVPTEEQIWQDPVPKAETPLIDDKDVVALETKILASGLSSAELVRTAWASAASFRGTDMRGGANGARIRLAPQKDWAINNPGELTRVLQRLEDIQKDFNKSGGKQVSLADLIVLGGGAAIEQAAKNAGHDVQVPFTPGRTDASQAQTDVASFAHLEPTTDGFRNYFGNGQRRSQAEMLVDRANLRTLTVPEMTVLVGGMRAMNANAGQTGYGLFTNRPGALTNDSS